MIPPLLCHPSLPPEMKKAATLTHESSDDKARSKSLRGTSEKPGFFIAMDRINRPHNLQSQSGL